MELFESVVRLNVGFLFDDIGLGLLDLLSLLLVIDKCFFEFLRLGGEQLILVDFAV